MNGRPKYRRQVWVGNFSTKTGRMLDAICADKGWPVISQEIQPDPIHLLLSIATTATIADSVKILKAVSARKLFARSQALKKHLAGGHLGPASYYIGTAGNVSAEMSRHRIEGSEHVTQRR